MGEVRLRRQPAAPAASPPQASPSNFHEKKLRRRFHASLPRGWLVLVGFVGFYASTFALVTFWHTWLPAPKGLDAPSDEFSEARARVVLEQIMSFGYRPVGTRANEELTPKYLLQQIEEIKATKPQGVNIEVDVQRPSGAFGLDFIAQFQNIYANVTNILVKVSPPDASPEALNNSLMISSHYDAAIGGAAASDDGVNIAIMVELLRLFVLDPPKHATLVFNFNGAEETIMQAAHGFITQHPWTDTIRAFINLEAAGAGGRELLFQTGSDELALAYAQGAEYPHASIIAQELFQSGIIPADTDYRIYRDFGYVAGMDFAYIANGYVYHTELDDVSRIQQGAVQRLGENIIGVVNQLGNEPGRLKKVSENPQSSNTFFSDVMGLTMVTASKETTFMLCGGVFLLAVLYLLLSHVSFSERLTAFMLITRCFGAAIASSLTVAILLSLYAPLPWYSQPYLAGVLFVSPALAGMLHQLVSVLEKKSDKVTPEALWRLEESLFEAMMCIWMGALAIGMQLGLISSYVLAVWIFFPLMGQVLCQLLQRVRIFSSTIYICISLGAMVIPVIHTMCCFAIALMFFVPLLGRSGPVIPPDVVLSLLMCVILLIMVSYSGRVFCFLPAKQLKLVRDVFILLTVASTAYASIRNPYSDDCPKRIMLQHVQREVVLPNGDVETDSGLWINSLDFRGPDPIKSSLASTQWRDARMHVAPEELYEHAEVYGHMPWSLPVKHMLPEDKSWYLPAAAPAIPSDVPKAKLEVLSSAYSAESDRRKIHFVFTGPSHMNLFIDAKKTKLTSWSMGNGVSGPVVEAEDAYILQFCSGTVPSSYHFWIEAESNKPIDVAFVGHFLEVTTPEMKEFSDVLPSWTVVASAVSTWTKMQI
ncbi:Endoplasmic reticulum metallopeptidase 1 [Phytophthora fragariae]|uniref:Endoplasmic reticulum metallopeptidase 1 n=1 Tax=Phytophthora fragariae TaxID=53985 RepID=A0A6A3TNA9_9STRA|nr:Endoplasmic reticulum metallopeptidase 1 [Phytophthora fragariae]KAE8936932.1 Endoplasmic reticulum metallopeptidase 1 [Phytophthora fragariae]KAE9001120.1 Endoplasmic reticulum metallopeptidase 1 [Phytophthora fragariae]KAE9101595.1 Endoplasmic reticulum metallopeptidase 1 [Phytophthora fragariae]KAE9115479.1 Endoplasmic reticulum metallopeptidase 1 [Phytophthora fragariae]